MTSHRIEITFVGDAPDSELERAKILGSEKISDAIESLKMVLESLGMDTKVSAHTVRLMPNKGRKPREPEMRVAGGQAAE